MSLTLKLQITAGKFLMELVAVDWLKDSKRMDHVARRQGCAAQVRAILIFFFFIDHDVIHISISFVLRT